MKYLIALALMFPMTVLAACPDPLPENTVCVEWIAPTTNVDGSPLTDLAGYNLYHGLEAGQRVGPVVIPADATDTVVNADDIVITRPVGGGEVPLYFVMTAFDDAGNVSSASNEVVKFLSFPDKQAPGAPELIRVLLNVRID